MTDYAVIQPWVDLTDDSVVEPFCVLGALPANANPESAFLRIGVGAVIRSHTVIYAGNTIGDRFQTGNKVNIREANEIGNDVSIGTLSVVEHHVRIADGVRIHTQAFVPEHTVLEEGVWIGPNVVFTNARYPVSRGVKDRLSGPVVKRGAIIGANATILPGVTIGEGALVGAGSVVVRDVPPRVVVAGNPARVIRSVDEIQFYDGATE